MSQEYLPGRPGLPSEAPPAADESDAVEGYVLPGATEQPCANHPGRLTYVTCSGCDKPLCPDCMVFSAVGIKCKECARLPRTARVMLRPGKLALAAAAGLATAIAIGFAYYFILSAIGFFFLFIFVASGIGYLVGEAVSRASGRFHGWQTALTAAAATIIGFLLPPLIISFLSYGVHWRAVLFALTARSVINWVVMAFSAFLAWNHNR